MKVLIINELAKSGGAEMQTMRECALLQQFGNEARVITLDPNFPSGWISETHYNISRKDSILKREIQMLLADKKIENELRKIIEDFNPDYIHLNNTKAHALSIFKAVEGYKCLRTIRDYGAVCPNSQSICADLSLCEGYVNCWKCLDKCIAKKKSLVKEVWKWICFKRRNSAQKKVIKNFACPSQMLTDYCNRFGLKTTCINNPFDFNMLDNHLKQTDFKRKIYLYYGQIIGFKGVEQLIEAFAEFSKGKEDVELHLAGTLPDVYKEKFQELLNRYNQGNIQYIGKLEYNDMILELLKVHTVVIPSLWIENYPNTALEATAAGCLVLGSERGGMREIIGSNYFIFHVLDKNEFVEKLNYSYNIPQDEYERITTEGQKRVRNNNSFEMYYKRLEECLKNMDK